MHVSRRTQAERRATTRAALLEAAARGLSRSGYGNLVLEQVAAEAGYTRGALYHQFSGKEELALAVVDWVAAQTNIWTGGYNLQTPINVGLPDRQNGFTFCRLRYTNVRRVRKSGWGDDYPNGDYNFLQRLAELTTDDRYRQTAAKTLSAFGKEVVADSERYATSGASAPIASRPCP